MNVKMKKALITGITGQDGYYLTKLLLKKNYKVYGIKRRTSLINTQRIDEFFEDKRLKDKNFFLYHGDMTDSSSLISILNKVKPNEIYNLAAQSHVKVSFEIPEYTANSDALGVLRLLDLYFHKDKCSSKDFSVQRYVCLGWCKPPQNFLKILESKLLKLGVSIIKIDESFDDESIILN